METRRSRASPHLKCDKTIGGKVLIAAPAARPVGKLNLIQFFACTVSKRSSFTISSNVFIGKENGAAGLHSLHDFGGTVLGFFYGAGTNNGVLSDTLEWMNASSVAIHSKSNKRQDPRISRACTLVTSSHLSGGKILRPENVSKKCTFGFSGCWKWK